MVLGRDAMQSKTTRIPGSQQPMGLAPLFRLAVLVLPCLLLAGGAFRATGDRAGALWFGAAVQLLGCILVLAGGSGWHNRSGPAVMVLYVTGLAWILAAAPSALDWYVHLARAILLVVPLATFAAYCLQESGASALRQARLLAARLARRTSWPEDLAECRQLPEVLALREALHIDASPALALLTDARPQVRVAALAALEYRQQWRSGQAEIVLAAARKAAEPEVRAAAVRALANRTDRETLEKLAEYLHDPSPVVRQAAAEALLWEADGLWAWIRVAVRLALSDPTCENDGPLGGEGCQFGVEALDDLTAWAAEKGLLGYRAALTLGHHYARQLAAGADSAKIGRLRAVAADVHAPAMLRLEIVGLLRQHKELDAGLLRQLTAPSTPAPLRLIAVEALLALGDSAQATAALHDLARLPNREMALATAAVIQRRLGVDLGLPADGPAPPVHSRQAADVARRVMLWASQLESDAAPPADEHQEAAW